MHDDDDDDTDLSQYLPLTQISFNFHIANGKLAAFMKKLESPPSTFGKSIVKFNSVSNSNDDDDHYRNTHIFKTNIDPQTLYPFVPCVCFLGLKQIEEEKNFNVEFPPCNIEYKADSGTRFWCTTQSGGIERDWAGFPIQLFNQDTKTFSCVCVRKENKDLPQLRPYENCDDATRSCSVQNEEEQQSNED